MIFTICGYRNNKRVIQVACMILNIEALNDTFPSKLNKIFQKSMKQENNDESVLIKLLVCH